MVGEGEGGIIVMRRTLTYIRNFFVTIIFLVIAYLLLVFLINLKDQQPSATAKEFEQSVQSRITIPDSENGFIYFLGLDSPENIDPLQTGIDRSKWIMEMNDKLLDVYTDFPQKFDSLEEIFSPELKTAFDKCKTIDDACIELVSANRTALLTWFSDESWVLERYQQLIGYSAWQETPIVNINMPMPRYSAAINLQRLYYIFLFSNIENTDATTLVKYIDRDLTFWRNAISHNDFIISKLISAAAIRNHFQWINYIALQYKIQNIALPLHQSLLSPFSTQEFSMRSCYIGEWLFIKSALNGVDLQLDGISLYLSKIAYQKQDSMNQHAALLEKLSNIVDVDIDQYEVSIKNLDNDEFKPRSFFQKLTSPYNFTGKTLIDLIDVSSYGDYATRVKDLEGARRALEISLKFLADEKIDLANKNLSNPYNNQPLIHDEENRILTFKGLSSSNRNVYQYKY
jgi:hypothetical protein